MTQFLFVLIILAALGSAIIGGVFYVFSSFVMAALGRLPQDAGARAMNEINITVLTPSFFAPFFGTAILSLVLLIWGAVMGGSASGALLIVAALLYLAGCIGVTMALNVPLNNRLKDAPPETIIAVWQDYLARWTFWNSVRTAASLVAAVLFVAALLTR